jgi:DNA-binding transcriptional regulator YiaG
MTDHTQLTTDILRVLRGKRSRAQFSRVLGYKSNVVFDWESGRRAPSALSILRALQRTGHDLRAVLGTFLGPSLVWPRRLSPASKEGVMLLSNTLKGNATIIQVSALLGVSRFTVSRWLKGQTELEFAQLLAWIDKASLRLLDFVAALMPPEQLPSVAAAWERLALARELAYEAPWSHAVLRALELSDYQALPAHRPGFLAARLGISVADEERYLGLLRRAGQVSWRNKHFVVGQSGTVDTRRDPVRSRALRAFWSRVAADRVESGANGEFAFNLFGVSRADLARLRELQRRYFQELRTIIGASEPVEEVVLFNLQLLPLCVE